VLAEVDPIFRISQRPCLILRSSPQAVSQVEFAMPALSSQPQQDVAPDTFLQFTENMLRTVGNPVKNRHLLTLPRVGQKFPQQGSET